MDHCAKRPKELHQEHTARRAVVHFSLKLCVAQCPFSVEASLLQSLTARKIPHRHTVQDSNILRCLMSFFFPFSKEISHIQINSTCIWPLIKFMLHNNPAAMMLCTLPSYSHPPKNIAVHVEIADSGSTNCNPGFIVTEALQFVLSGGCEARVPLTFLMFVSIQEDKMLPSSAVSPTASQNLGAWHNASIINCYKAFTTKADMCALEFYTAFHINRLCWNANESLHILASESTLVNTYIHCLKKGINTKCINWQHFSLLVWFEKIT